MEQKKSLRAGCLVMAAGNGARFGENKLSACLGDRTLIQRTLDAIPADVFSKVIVVTQYEQVEAAARRRGFLAVRNTHPDWGVSHTILLGTQALQDCDGILYLVADQPLLTAFSVRQVVLDWMEHPDTIACAAHNGRRGNPCLFPKDLFPELMALAGDKGGSQVIRAHPERVRLVEIPEPELTDVDTPETLEQLQKNLEK